MDGGRGDESPKPFTLLEIGTPGRRIGGRFLAVPVAWDELSAAQWDAVTALSRTLELDLLLRTGGPRAEQVPADRLVLAISARRIRTGDPHSQEPEDELPSAESAAELTRSVLEELLLAAGMKPLMAVTGAQDAVALAALAVEDLTQAVTALRTAAAGLSPGLRRERLVLGVSGIGRGSVGSRGLIEQARQARRVAEQAGGPGQHADQGGP